MKIAYDILSLAKGGTGVSKATGKTFFIEGALPGEQGFAEVIEEKKSFGRARAISREHDAPCRSPHDACPMAEQCGGCGFRHVLPADALRLKSEALATEIFKLAHIEPIEPVLHPVMPPESSLDGLRQRMRLHLNRSGIGYFACNSHQIVSAANCPVIDPALREVVRQLEKIKPPVPGFRCELQIDLDDEKRPFLHIKPIENAQTNASRPQAKPEKPAVWLNQIVKSGLFAGIRFDRENISGAAMIRDVVSIPDHPKVYYWRRIGDFAQATRQANVHLHQIVADFCMQTRPREAADLFSGSGNLTFRAAQFVPRVHACEYFCDTEAFQRGLTRNQPTWPEHTQVDLKRYNLSAGLPQNAVQCDAAICDPAREGLSDKLCHDLKQSKIQHLLYISCEATNLARDLTRLGNAFHLAKLHFVDMFPMTPHVETVAWLERNV